MRLSQFKQGLRYFLFYCNFLQRITGFTLLQHYFRFRVGSDLLECFCDDFALPLALGLVCTCFRQGISPWSLVSPLGVKCQLIVGVVDIPVVISENKRTKEVTQH